MTSGIKNNGDSIEISKSIVWGIVVFFIGSVLLAPIAWLSIKQNATDILLATHGTIIENVTDDIKEMKNTMNKIYESVIKNDSTRGGDSG